MNDRSATSSAEGRLREPEFDRLWVRAREVMERTGGSLAGAFRASPSASPEERRALQGLIGGSSSLVRLAALDASLRAAVGVGLTEWLVEIGGPLRDRPAERYERQRRRNAAEAVVFAHPLAARPWFEMWLAAVRSDGSLANAIRLEERQYLEAALALLGSVLGRSRDRVPLARVVAEATGDTKRLHSATVRAMVEQALALEASSRRPVTSGERRILWRQFGIVVDDVSSDVLVLNLSPRAGSGAGLAGWLREAAVLGEPFRVTLRQLASAVLSFDPVVASVCENPAVVMDAASRLGPMSGPILCTEGVPTDGFWALSEMLVAGGASLQVHADFDAAGCRIAGSVIERVGAVPWRFDAESYRDALARFGSVLVLPPSRGVVPVTPWDPALGSALAGDGRAVYEEVVVSDLIGDLSRPGRG